MLRMKNVRKSYGDFQLDCTFEVADGCITGLIGENGAGKSTSFKIVQGLVIPDSGEIELFGKPYKDITLEEKKKTGAVLSESTFSEIFTVRDIVRIMQVMYADFRKEEFLSRCRQFSIPLDKQLKGFSSGMKAKLKLLVALSHDTKLLILDEPTAGLDVAARDSLLDLIREYMEEDEERSVLISSHISGDLEHLCDDIYMIHDGKIVLHEETDVLLGNYGILKVNAKQYEKLDKSSLMRVRKESFGYRCLTDQIHYYRENYPDAVIEKGTIDEVIMMMIKGERV